MNEYSQKALEQWVNKTWKDARAKEKKKFSDRHPVIFFLALSLVGVTVYLSMMYVGTWALGLYASFFKHLFSFLF